MPTLVSWLVRFDIPAVASYVLNGRYPGVCLPRKAQIKRIWACRIQASKGVQAFALSHGWK